MANPQKGEVGFESEGKSYKLAFTTNCMCEVEELLGRGWFDIAFELEAWAPKDGSKESEADARRRVGKMKMSTLRALFWGMLREHQPDITVKQAGELMGTLGQDKDGALGLINKVFDRSMPKGAASGEGPNPPQPGRTTAADGTGPGLSGPGSV